LREEEEEEEEEEEDKQLLTTLRLVTQVPRPSALYICLAYSSLAPPPLPSRALDLLLFVSLLFVLLLLLRL
jgi:hypothetical protein